MSDRTLHGALTGAIRSAYRAVYRKGTRDQDKIAEYIYDQTDYLRHANNKRVWLFYIKKMLGLPNSRKRSAASETQVDLFEDMDQPLALLHDNGQHTFCDLGDFGLDEIAKHTRQVEANLAAVSKALDIWNAAVAVVRPVLEGNPDWRWRDAVDYLRDRGGLPVLETVE